MAPSKTEEPVDDISAPETPSGRRPRSLYFLGAGLVLLTLMLALAY